MAGNIYINEDAANADIAKIRAAITRLEEAQSSIKKLSNSADNMTGQTGEAIKEKCTTLDSQIKSLTGNLNYTIRLIKGAIQEYQQKDAEMASAIKSGLWQTLRLIRRTDAGGIVSEESGDDLRRTLHPDEDDDRTDLIDLGGQCEQGIYGDDG